MRSVAAVVALVACLHAGVWAFGRARPRLPISRESSSSVSYSPFRGSAHPDDGGDRPTEAQIRADLKTHRALHPGDPALFVDRRRRTGAADRQRVRPQGDARHLARQEREAQRARNPFRDRPRAQEPQHQRHHRRQRDDLPRRNEGRRTHQEHPAGQARGQRRRAGDHRRNLERLCIEHPELASAVDFIAAHVLPYWEGVPAEGRGRSGGAWSTAGCARLSRQAHRHRGIRLAERRL